jgi:SWI/SNF-related matrix-associated actin-dependent regulator 1 of chromatin subfamily A
MPIIPAKYNGKCKQCGRNLEIGQHIFWEHGQGAVCIPCYTNSGEVSSYRQSWKDTSDIVIPAPDGLDYLPFQRAGIEFCISRQNVLLADSMGLGKTVQAIGLINKLYAINRVLVLCPASLRLNWKKELEKWLVRKRKILVLNANRFLNPSEWDIIITNYDIVHKHFEKLRRGNWDLLICDEAHYLKNKKARRTKYVFGGGDIKEGIRAKRKLFLTGTPIENNPGELWPLLNALRPDLFSNWWTFVQRYCGAYRDRFNQIKLGKPTNLDELHDQLRTHVMVRRLKEQVLTELPPKIRQVIELPANGASSVVAAENTAWQTYEHLKGELASAVAEAEASEDPEVFSDRIKQLRYEERVAFGEIARRRKETAIAKIPYVLAHLDNVSEKVVVFAHHKDVIAAIAEKMGKKAVKLDGGTAKTARQEAVDRFQSDPDIKCFIGSLTAAGVGITLTAASHVVFAELDWVPGKVAQAEDRCHRISQKNSVLIQHLVFEDSLDCKMAKTIVEKQEMIDQALDTGGTL